jgi:hypothetical protein
MVRKDPFGVPSVYAARVSETYQTVSQTGFLQDSLFFIPNSS